MAKKAKKTKKSKAVPKKAAKPVKEEKSKEIRIVNIVVSGSLDKSKIPLEKMAATLPNTEYNP